MPKRRWSFFMPAEDHRQVKRLIAFTQSRLTVWGKILSMVILAGMAVSAVGTRISAYLLPSFIFSLFLTSFILSLFFRPKVTAERILPLSPQAGEHCAYSVIVTNTSRRPIRNLSIFESTLPFGLYADYKNPQLQNTIDWLQPNEQSTLTLCFRTPRRGIFELPKLIATSSFPAGLIRSTRKVGKPEKFIVYPKLIKKDILPAMLHKLFQPGGISPSLHVGDSNEFAGTREYREGDRLRDVHWPSSARSGKIIVKEYIEEYFTRAGFFLDTELLRDEKELCLESRISLCAGLAETLNEKNYVIDLFLNDPQHPYIHADRGLQSFYHLLEICSAIEGNEKSDFHQSLKRIQELAPQLSVLIILLKDLNEERLSFVKKLECLDINMKTIVIHPKAKNLDKPTKADHIFTPEELIKNHG